MLTQSTFDVTVKAMLNANYGHPSREVLETLVAAPIDARSRNSSKHSALWTSVISKNQPRAFFSNHHRGCVGIA